MANYKDELILISNAEIVNLGDYNNPIFCYKLTLTTSSNIIFTMNVYKNSRKMQNICDAIYINRGKITTLGFIGQVIFGKVFKNTDDKTGSISMNADYFTAPYAFSDAKYMNLSPNPDWSFDKVQKYKEGVKSHISNLQISFNFTYPKIILDLVEYNLNQPFMKWENPVEVEYYEAENDEFPDTYYIGEQEDYESDEVEPGLYNLLGLTLEEMEALGVLK